MAGYTSQSVTQLLRRVIFPLTGVQYSPLRRAAVAGKCWPGVGVSGVGVPGVGVAGVGLG